LFYFLVGIENYGEAINTADSGTIPNSNEGLNETTKTMKDSPHFSFPQIPSSIGGVE